MSNSRSTSHIELVRSDPLLSKFYLRIWIWTKAVEKIVWLDRFVVFIFIFIDYVDPICLEEVSLRSFKSCSMSICFVFILSWPVARENLFVNNIDKKSERVEKQKMIISRKCSTFSQMHSKTNENESCSLFFLFHIFFVKVFISRNGVCAQNNLFEMSLRFLFFLWKTTRV